MKLIKWLYYNLYFMKIDGGRRGNVRGKYVNIMIKIYNVVYYIGYDDVEFIKFICNMYNK